MRVFISSPVRGNYTENLELARRVFIALLTLHVHPVCPHLLLLKAIGFSDRDSRLRTLGMDYSMNELLASQFCAFIKKEDGTLSQGCREELKLCNETLIPYKILDWPTFIMEKQSWTLDDAKYNREKVEEWYNASER